MAVLETAFESLSAETPEILRKFAFEIADVASKEKDSTTFFLPEHIREGIEYSIVTSGAFDMEKTAWKIYFDIQSMVKIQDIMLVLIANQTSIMINLRASSEYEHEKYKKWGNFDNLKLIDREGKVYVDPQIYRNPRPDPTVTHGPPYNLDDSPSGTFFILGQTVEIYRDGDLIIIKADLTTEQIVVE